MTVCICNNTNSYITSTHAMIVDISWGWVHRHVHMWKNTAINISLNGWLHRHDLKQSIYLWNYTCYTVTRSFAHVNVFCVLFLIIHELKFMFFLLYSSTELKLTFAKCRAAFQHVYSEFHVHVTVHAVWHHLFVWGTLSSSYKCCYKLWQTSEVMFCLKDKR